MTKNIRAKVAGVSGAAVLLLASLSGAVPLLSQTAFAAGNITVCASGCDATTIQAGIDGVDPGGTVTVEPGTYDGSDIKVNKSVSLVGQTGAIVKVPNVNGTNGFDITANNVSIEGFDIVGPADGTSYLNYAWGTTVTRGIAVANGVTDFTISGNTIEGLRNDVLIDGRNTGSLANNTIDNSKSGVSVQYTDAGAGNSEGYSITMTGNHDSTFGNEWGVNTHLNGHYSGGTYYSNSQKIAADAPTAVQQALLANSTANGGWTVQDQGYTNANRTTVSVASTGSDSAQGSPLAPLATIQAGITGTVSGGQVIVGSGDYTITTATTVNKKVDIEGQGNPTINTSGSAQIFTFTGAGSVLNGFTITKTDNTNQNIIGIQANDVSITNNHFSGQYSLAANAGTTRALVVSTSSDTTISGNTITDLRQPAYINDNATGHITNNYIDDTRGWVLVANSNFSFTGNTWGTNATDIAIIDNDANPNTPVTDNYTCSVMAQIRADNHNASIDNQVLTSPCDTTPPSVPTLLSPVDRGYSKTNDFYFDWTDSTDNSNQPVTYEFQSSQNPHTTNGTLDTGVWDNIANGNSEQKNLTESKIHSTGAPDGAWYWQVRAIDAAGNKSAWTPVWHMTIDTHAPATTLQVSNLSNGYVNSRQNGNKLTVTGHATDNLGMNRVLVQLLTSKHGAIENHTVYLSGTSQDWSTTFDVKQLGLADGTYSVVAVVTDNAGNTSAKGQYLDFTLDNTKPSVAFTSPTPASGSYESGNFTVGYTASDNVALKSVNVSLFDTNPAHSNHWVATCYANSAESGASDSGTCTVHIPAGTPDGKYYIQVGAQDKALNWSVNQTRTIYLDQATLAAPALISPLNNAVVNGASVTNSWGSVSGAAKYEYQSFNSSNTAGTPRYDATYNGTSKTATNVANGTVFYWRVRAVDQYGKPGDWSTLWKVTIDDTAPNVPTNLAWTDSNGHSVASGDSTNLVSGTASWQDGSNDVNHYIYKYWNNIPTSAYDSPANAWTTTTGGTSLAGVFNQGEGTHYFCVEAVDAAGNTSACSTPFSIVYDTTAPVVTVDTESTTDTTPTVTGTVNDKTATVSITVNSHSYTASVNQTANLAGTYSWSANVSNALAAGSSYDVAATATDPAGNVGHDSTTGELSITTVVNSTVSNLTHFFSSFLQGGSGSGNTNSQGQNASTVATNGGGSAGGAGSNGQVLGAITNTPNTSSSDNSSNNGSGGEVKGLSTSNQNAKKSSEFLGLGWWWLPILVIVLLFIFGLRRASDGTDKP